MIQIAHNLYLFYQALFSVLFAICCFFRESLNSVFLLSLYFLDQIDWCEVSFSDFLDRFECLMKAFLVEIQSQNRSPLFLIVFRKSKTHWFMIYFKFNIAILNCKLQIEIILEAHFTKYDQLFIQGYIDRSVCVW